MSSSSSEGNRGSSSLWADLLGSDAETDGDYKDCQSDESDLILDETTLVSTEMADDAETVPDDCETMQCDQTLESKMQPNYQQIYNFILPYLLPSSWKLRRLAFASIIFEALVTILGLIPTYALKNIVDGLTENQNYVNYSSIVLFAVSALLIRILHSAQNYCTFRFLSEAGRKFDYNCLKHLMNLDYIFHAEYNSGKLIGMISEAWGGIHKILFTAIFAVVPTTVEIIAVTYMVSKTNSPKILGVLLVGLGTYLYVSVKGARSIMKKQKEVSKLYTTIHSKQSEIIRHFETIKIFGNEEEQVDHVDALSGTALHNNMSITAYIHLYRNILAFINVGCVVTCLLLAAENVKSRKISSGDLFMIVFYIKRVFSPLLRLAREAEEVLSSLSKIEEWIEVSRTKPRIVDCTHPGNIEEGSRGQISFESVSFKYPCSKDNVLRNISFTVPVGSKLGIVGAVGSGKSTIFKLILRLLKPTEGSIKFGGTDISLLKQNAYRRIFGVVSQNGCMMDESIRHNVTFGKRDATDSEIWEALEAVEMKQICEEAKNGLETIVGEDGIKLSGGQVQRIQIARVLITSPSIFLFDEATSSMDVISERKMRENLRELCGRQTTIVIAHRLSTIVDSDNIIVLDNGCIAEQGTHDDLLALKGKYYDLWNPNNHES